MTKRAPETPLRRRSAARRLLRGLLPAALLAFALAAAAPAGADWLVKTDGTLVETRGRWVVQGNQVAFIDAKGRQQTLPAAALDMPTSVRATLAARTGGPQAADRGLAAAAAAAKAARAASPPAVASVDERHVGRAADPDATAAKAPVVLYSTTWCQWCRKTRELFTEMRVPFEERDVERSPAAMAERDRLAGADAGVPVIARGDRVVRGYDPVKLRALVSDLVPKQP